MFSYGAGESALLMSEEFTVDGALGDRAAVDGDVLLAPALTVVMDDARYDFLTHTTFSLDEYREVGGSHLHGSSQSLIQCFVPANYSISVLKTLQFH